MNTVVKKWQRYKCIQCNLEMFEAINDMFYGHILKASDVILLNKAEAIPYMYVHCPKCRKIQMLHELTNGKNWK